MSRRRLSVALVLSALVLVAVCAPLDGVAAQPKPEGEMRWALYITISPNYFDPGEVVGQLTPFWFLYAMHDALVKPMPGNHMTPSLAESWTVSPDGRVYEFKLREGLKFHNGDPFTADDVKFSFERAKGKVIREKVKEVTVVSPSRVRFTLHEPWPDFMAFYGTLVTGASWVVPKKYFEQVGPDGLKKHPVGLGPYKFVSHTPGVELVMEAFEGYWRKTPSVKRLVFKSVPEATTRAAMLKRGEVDIAYLLDAPQALELQRDRSLRVAFSGGIGIFFLDFFDQWDPKSPWADKRVRQAANYAIDRQALSEAETLGASKPAGNHVPRSFEFALPLEPYPYDPARAKKLLAEAGYPNGFDAGDYYVDVSYSNLHEVVVNYLQQIGIRAKLIGRERASHWSTYADKKYKNLAYTASGAFGNAATRLETFVIAGGAYVYGNYPDLDSLFKDQAAELDRKKREALLHKIQQLMHEKVMHIPIWELAFINGHGPRIQESGLGLIPGHAYSAPYEDVKLKTK